jgi:hypothetical protein
VVKIIENIYKGGNFEKILLNRIEYRAGRRSLDALGTIGIARRFTMGLRTVSMTLKPNTKMTGRVKQK